MSHWKYNDEIIDELPKGVVGFVYLITNLTNGRKYIGRKYATSTKRKPLTKTQVKKGRVRRDVITKESDWATYTGSNNELNEDIKLLGKDNFEFKILYFGKTRGVINFLEETTHHKNNVLLDPLYYNNCIGPRRFMALAGNKELREILMVK